MGVVTSALMILAPLLANPTAESADQVQAQFPLHPVEQSLIDRTNAERARYGLHPLMPDRNLIISARQHAAWMTNRRALQHTRQSVAENIAMGQRDSADALRSWMNSPGHRANILNRSYRRIGVAAYTTPEGTIYWCQQFQP